MWPPVSHVFPSLLNSCHISCQITNRALDYTPSLFNLISPNGSKLFLPLHLAENSVHGRHSPKEYLLCPHNGPNRHSQYLRDYTIIENTGNRNRPLLYCVISAMTAEVQTLNKPCQINGPKSFHFTINAFRSSFQCMRRGQLLEETHFQEAHGAHRQVNIQNPGGSSTSRKRSH